MNDEMTDCTHLMLPEVQETKVPTSTVAGVMNQLPTLQRNALRKIFDRHEFTPAEVAELGYRRLQQAEGIGNKGLASITAWLRQHGFDLKVPEPHETLPVIRSKSRRNIEMAVRLLRTHGYIVQGGSESSGNGTPPFK